MTPTDDLTEDEQAELRRLATQLGHAEIELMLDAQGRSQAGMQARALHLELRRLRGIEQRARELAVTDEPLAQGYLHAARYILGEG